MTRQTDTLTRPPLVDLSGLDLSTPEGAAQARLRATTTEGLLAKAYELTHRIHECKGSTVAGQCDGPCTDQRAMRDLITAEVLRRAGEQS